MKIWHSDCAVNRTQFLNLQTYKNTCCLVNVVHLKSYSLYLFLPLLQGLTLPTNNPSAFIKTSADAQHQHLCCSSILISLFHSENLSRGPSHSSPVLEHYLGSLSFFLSCFEFPLKVDDDSHIDNKQ